MSKVAKRSLLILIFLLVLSLGLSGYFVVQKNKFEKGFLQLSGQIVQFKNREQEAINKIGQLSKKIGQLHDNKTKLESSLNAFQQEVNSVKEELKGITQRYDHVTNRVEELRGIRDDLVKSLAEEKAKRNNIKWNKEKSRKMLDEFSDMKDKSKAMTKQLEKLKRNNKGLRKNLQKALLRGDSEKGFSNERGGGEQFVGKRVSIDLPPIIIHSGLSKRAMSNKKQSVLGNKKRPVLENKKFLRKEDVNGKVISINEGNNFLIINMGKDKGTRIGDMFGVYRNQRYIARIKVIQVRKDIAAADIIDQVSRIKSEDEVK